MHSPFEEKLIAMPEIKTTGKNDPMEGMETFDRAATRRLLRKVDLRLIPFLALLYLQVLSLIDGLELQLSNLLLQDELPRSQQYRQCSSGRSRERP